MSSDAIQDDDCKHFVVCPFGYFCGVLAAHICIHKDVHDTVQGVARYYLGSMLDTRLSVVLRSRCAMMRGTLNVSRMDTVFRMPSMWYPFRICPAKGRAWCRWWYA